MNKCRLCKKSKPDSEFYKRKVKSGHKCRSECKRCFVEMTKGTYSRERLKNSRIGSQPMTALRRRNYKAKYEMGITWEEGQEEIEKRRGVCDLCKKERKLVLDHDHERRLFRGCICQACNIALGVLGDSVAGLMRAVSYLRKTERVSPREKGATKRSNRAIRG